MIPAQSTRRDLQGYRDQSPPFIIGDTAAGRAEGHGHTELQPKLDFTRPRLIPSWPLPQSFNLCSDDSWKHWKIHLSSPRLCLPPSPPPTNHILGPSVIVKLSVLVGVPVSIVLHTQMQEGLQVWALIRWWETAPDLSYSQVTTFQVVLSLCRRQWVPDSTTNLKAPAAKMSAERHLQSLHRFMQ